MKDYPPSYDIYQSCLFKWKFWVFFYLFIGGGGIFLALTQPTVSSAFYAGILGIIFACVTLILTAKKWKKRLLCTLSDEGIQTTSPPAFYPWEQLNDVIIISNTFCLTFGNESTSISCVLVKEKKKDLIRLIAHYSQMSKFAEKE